MHTNEAELFAQDLSDFLMEILGFSDPQVALSEFLKNATNPLVKPALPIVAAAILRMTEGKNQGEIKEFILEPKNRPYVDVLIDAYGGPYQNKMRAVIYNEEEKKEIARYSFKDPRLAPSSPETEELL